MARVVILGAGIAGHTAALRLRRALGRSRDHEVVVVSPNANWNWIPSNIWVGVGRMPREKVVFPLAPVYAKRGIAFRQAKAVAIRPGGDADDPRPAVDIEYTDPERFGETERLRYDHLMDLGWKFLLPMTLINLVVTAVVVGFVVPRLPAGTHVIGTVPKWFIGAITLALFVAFEAITSSRRRKYLASEYRNLTVSA